MRGARAGCRAAAAAGLALLVAALPARGAEPAADPPAAAVLADLPFLDPPDANRVRIDLAPPGGRPLPLLLDTGATHSFATAGGARALGITLRRNKQTPYRRATRLGRDLQLLVDLRRTDTGEASGGDYALVGAAFLVHYVLELDFPGGRVRFLDPDHWQVPAEGGGDGSVLPMRPGDVRPVVEIEVGGARVPAAITTGAPGTLILPGGFAEEAGVRIDPEATARLDPTAGTRGMQAGVAPSVRLGRFEEPDVPMLVAPDGLWGRGAKSDAVLGVDFVKRYVLRIDYPRRRLQVLRPAPAQPPRPAAGAGEGAPAAPAPPLSSPP